MNMGPMLFALMIATADKHPPITLCILVSPEVKDGLVQPSNERRDSARDLYKQLRDTPSMQLKTAPCSGADITVDILGREMQAGVRTVSASVTVGDSIVQMTGVDDGDWRDSAEKLARHLKQFVADNRSRILSNRPR